MAGKRHAEGLRQTLDIRPAIGYSLPISPTLP
jgi:hypothetical protein